MSPEVLFLSLNYGVLIPWGLLVLAPRWRPSRWVADTIALPIAFGGVYGLVMALAPLPPGGTDLPAIARVLGSPWGATAVWIHALTFDLFVGAWIVRDARRRGLAHRWVAPCLLLTLLYGPAGPLVYLGGWWLRSRRSTLRERSSREAAPRG